MPRLIVVGGTEITKNAIKVVPETAFDYPARGQLNFYALTPLTQ